MHVYLNEAVSLLHQKKVVAIPTETVYGLAARFDSEDAIKDIFDLKNRPLDHPLIVHIGSLDWLKRLTYPYPSYVDKLIKTFWPGPLTLVLPKSELVSPLITANQSTVAIRMPSHPVCLQLLLSLDMPIVAPSANPYCRISPTCAEHVYKYFMNNVPILDGGNCNVGIESTIMLATKEESFQILRPGAITAEEIQAVSNISCSIANKKIKISGNKQKHYAPNVPLIPFTNRHEIEHYIHSNQKKFLFILINKISIKNHYVYYISKDPKKYATCLYSLWHEAEDKNYDAIIIEKPIYNTYWNAIIDRIDKASKSIAYKA